MDGPTRRAWLDRQSARFGNALRYYAGPGLAPAVNALGAFGPDVMGGADFRDAHDFGGRAVNALASGNAWQGVQDGAQTLAALGAIAIPGVSAAGLRGGVEVGENALSGIRAFHGSSHDFDRFSMDKIGTGEGAQAYGHGLYFAESEGVAKSYRDTLAAKHTRERVHKAYGPEAAGVFDDIIGGQTTFKSWEQSARNSISQKARELGAQTTADLERLAALEGGPFPYDRPATNLLREMRGYQATKMAYDAGELTPGRMYEVNIAASPDDFLDWDAPLSAQPPNVQAALGGVSEKYPGMDTMDPASKFFKPDAAHGSGVYGRLKGEEIAPGVVAKGEGAASILRDAGIPGIKYLDAGSRGVGDGTRNYVVFDDRLVTILRKYGIGAFVAGGGYALTQDEYAMLEGEQDAMGAPQPGYAF